MADENPELQHALQELDRELEEEYITPKGYQKRRTLLLSQFGALNLNGQGPTVNVHGAGPQADNYSGRYPSVGSDSSSGIARQKTPSLLIPERATSRASVDSLFLPKQSTLGIGPEDGRTETLLSQSYAFNPNDQYEHPDQTPMSYDAGAYDMDGGPTRQSTLVDSQAYFQDFAGHQNEDYRNSYGGGFHRYSQSDAFSPTANMAPPLMPTAEMPGNMLGHLQPLEPRDIPFSVSDPHDPSTMMSKFENLPAVLRHRAKIQSKQPAYWVLDQKGKEIASITWDKLASRAEKVAQIIRDKSSLYRGDRVALIYRDTELIEFAVALMGCFIAGVVAVPINNIDDYASLNVILTSTQAHLALTTENNLKNFQRDITTQKLQWPRGVEWWKTNEFGSYHPKKKDEAPALVVPDLAYIEFSRAPTGDLRGVVMSHRTIMHQMACLSAIVATMPGSKSGGLQQNRILGGGHGETLFSYLDPRQSIGMILGVLLTVYGGHTTVWLEAQAVETPGLYAHLITKYRATVMAADYPGLKRVAYNYQADPMTTLHFKKNSEPNFSTVKLCLIDTLTVDSEFHEILTDRWLKPLRNARAREIVAPMLCLPEHGGMVVSVRDWLGGEERMGCPLTHPLKPQEPEQVEADKKKTDANDGFGSSLIGGTPVTAPKKTANNDLAQVLLDKEALKSNEIVVLAMGEQARKLAESRQNCVLVGAFGYPLPDATLAVVDPETNLLCTPNVIGEIWVDSPSLSGGFWALPKHTETIFHARPYKFELGNPTPVLVEPEFLRTGLLGCVIEGKIFVLGLYEDRLRQKVEWVEHGQEIVEHRYFFVQHLIISIMRNVPKVNDCSAFDVFVNDEHLPIVVLESYTASTAPTTSGGPPRQLDTALLESLAERCMEVLYHEHHLRVYCVMITAPNTLPRVTKNGRREIGNMLCRKEFDNGTLPCVHVKFGAERAVMNLPLGVDPVGGMWSPLSSDSRQDILAMEEKQYSGVDYRDIVMDDRTSTPLNNFTNMVDLVQWRVTRQADELCYCSIDGRGKESKGVTWKKFDQKVAAVASYLKNKVKVRPGDHLVLMYTHSEEYVFAVHACLCLGAVAIPMAPIDQNRLPEDAPAFLHVISDFKVKAIIVNNDVDHVMKQKLVSQHIKQSAQVLRIGVPAIYNTTKPPKQSHGCRDLGFTMNKAWLQPNHAAVIWTHWTADQRRISVQLNHDTLMAMCKVQKETCQMTSARPVLGSVRSSVGLGFLHTCLLGCYVGAPTYLVSPVDFAQNPASLFVALARYKIKDTYATGQMLEYAMSSMAGKGFQLQELKNLMIATDGRPKVDMYQKVRLHFAATALDRTAINTIYSHVLNPMVASRSYMCIEPIELWLDLRALRRGLIYPVDPDVDPTALRLQDSGMVPVNTQLAIVNPETCTLCRVGEYGEIWIQSDACAKSFYGSKQEFDLERFNGRVLDGDTSVQYVRTGDLGFLHTVTRPIGPGGQPVEMQVLFVLGGIGETFEINGLNHFPVDIEASVEKCHRNIVAGGCAVFQAGGLVVVLVEVTRKSYLASLVPVIVNAVLNDHQVVADIVAFVSYGDFPRSRLGEKQRGKILGSWVTRKMRTIAQFSIRDADGADPQMLGQSRMSRESKTGSIMGGSSLRRSTLVPDSDSSTRAPPPVQEGRELVDEPYTMQEDDEEKHYQDLLNENDYQQSNDNPHGVSEQEQRPETQGSHQSPNIETYDQYEKDSNPTPVLSTHHGFDFGTDFGQSTFRDDFQQHEGRSRGVPSVAIAPPSTSGSQESGASYGSFPRGKTTDKDLLPSQQQRYKNDGQSWSNNSSRPISAEEWPQEALLYQSQFDQQGSNGHARQGGANHGQQPRDESEFNVF